MELWPIARHTAAKHAILKHYLDAWLPIMGRYNRRLVFIDGFAGPGEYAGGEPGSPIIALDCALNHTHNLSGTELVYLFIEQDAGNRENLRRMLGERQIPPHIRFEVQGGQFDKRAADILDRVEEQGKSLAPAFVMIDPFGFSGVPFELIRRLAAQPKSEVLFSLMSASINRFLERPELAKTFDALFGVEVWRRVHSLPSGAQRWDAIYRIYADQLREAGFEKVRAFEMKDDGGRTEYHLTFATHDRKGLEKMKDAMWTVDPSGQYRFSDTTNPDQLTLFRKEPDLHQLERELLETFRGATASVAALEDFVVCQTAFRKPHLKPVLRALKASRRIIVSGARVRHNSFPDDALITFPLL